MTPETNLAGEVTKSVGLLEIIRKITLVFLFLFPLFIFPLNGWGVVTSKAILFEIYALLVVIFYSLHLWLNRKELSLNFNIFQIGIIGICLATVISSLLNNRSFSGLLLGDFDITGAFFTILLSLVLMAVASTVWSAREALNYGIAFILGGVAAIFIQVLKVLLGAIVTLPLWAGGPTFSLIGKWNDVGVISVLLAVLSLMLLQRLPKSSIRIFTYIVFFVALFGIIIVNLNISWVVLGVMGIFGILFALRDKEMVDRKFYIGISGFIILLSLLMFTGLAGINNRIGGLVSSTFNIQSVEIYPSPGSSLEVAKNSLSGSEIFFGTGPGSFKYEWKLYRPIAVNLTPFWGIEFNTAVGFLPTFVITLGLLGSILWIILIGAVAYISFKSYVYSKNIPQKITQFVVRAYSILVVVLWIIFFVYAPGYVTFLITTMLTAILAGLASSFKIIPSIRVPLIGNNFISQLALVILYIVLAGGSLFFLSKEVIAVRYFEKANWNANVNQNIDAALTDSLKAYEWNKRDIYARAIAELGYVKFNQIISTSTPGMTTENLQQMLDAVINYSAVAVQDNPREANNFIFLAELYRDLHLKGVEGSYANSLASYTEAENRDPFNPLIQIGKARLELQNNSLENAAVYLGKALELKPNYTEAAFLLSQILINQGKDDEALQNLEKLTQNPPVDPIVFFQIGFFKYSQKDYAGAAQALEQAVIQVPDYANAMYFLGLSYHYLGKDNEAIALFRRISELNPEIEEVRVIINNLAAGRDPFVNQRPPADVAPEKRDELPVKETGKPENLE